MGDNLYSTPRKSSILNSEYKRKLSSPESLFTPLKIPGAMKDDSDIKSKLIGIFCSNFIY